MKFNKIILASALISTLSLPALADTTGEHSATSTIDNASTQVPGGFPMNRQGNMNPANSGFSGMPMDMNRMNMGQMDMGRMNMGNMNMRPGNYPGMPMMNMGQPQNMPMMQYRQNQMPPSTEGGGHHPGGMNKQAGMGMPMMKMMPQKMAEMKQHRERVEKHLTNIDSSLQQLVELQKAK